MNYKTKEPEKSQASMPRAKSGAGSNQNNERYGDNQKESRDAGVTDQKGLDEGRPHGTTGGSQGLTTGKPSGRPANLFDK